MALQIASALQFLHENGVVHRDIKTANIFVCRNGVLKLLDFGLARHFGPPHGEGEGSGSADEAEVLGTANYIAPERLLKLPADPRSDLFSLGVVMYEMAARRLPFAGESTAETVFNVLTEEPAPLSAMPIPRPRWFVRLVEKLLEKKMRRRYQSAAALRIALNRRGSTVRLMVAPPQARPSQVREMRHDSRHPVQSSDGLKTRRGRREAGAAAH
jgi:serine/threonine-protein kinase